MTSFSSELLIVDYHDSNASRDFTHSLKNTGFAVIKNHPISAQLVDEVYSEWKDFFASSEKVNYLYDKAIQEGYFPFQSENAKHTPIKDLKEFYHYYPWGRLPQGMSDKTPLLYKNMTELAATLLGWIEVNLPQQIRNSLSMPLKEMITNCPQILMRILHYPPIPEHTDAYAVRAADHEDIGLLTLLPAATANGLQVKDRTGQWHDVPCDYGTIVVNTGDTLNAIIDNYLPATTHRVVNPIGEASQQSRLSMPLFLHPRDEIILPDGRTALDYLRQRLDEIGLINK